MRAFILAIAFGFSLFFCIGSVLLYKPSTKLVSTIHYERCENCKIETKEDKDFIESLRSDPTAAFTALLFVATVLLAFVTIGLYIEAKNTGKEQVSASKDAALQAQRSAIAAERAIEVAKFTSESQLRAYICCTQYESISFQDPIIQNRLAVIGVASVYENAGRTPALNVFSTTMPFVLYQNEDTVINFNIPDNIDKISATCGVGGRFTGSHAFFMFDDIVKLKEKKARLFVYSCIFYRTVFSESVESEERCVELILRNDPLVIDSTIKELFFFRIYTKFISQKAPIAA